ncbi:MAG: hypothetical protein PVF51_14130 [Nitrospirota bacterium]|jgi:hypothetical protein
MSPIGLPNPLMGATAFSPSAGSPEWHAWIATIGVPWISFGSQGAGGAGPMKVTSVSSGGAFSARPRKSSSTAGASLAGQATTPPTTSGPTT